MLPVQVARRKVDGAEVAREAQLGEAYPPWNSQLFAPWK